MWWKRRRTQRDFSDEIQAHIDLEADALMRSGMSEDDARAAARRTFGNVGAAEERFFESARMMWLERLRQDARYAARALRRSPVYTLTALATLALGIGVNTTVFTFVYALGMRPLPVRDAARVVTVYQDFRGEYSRKVQGSRFLFSLPEYIEHRDRARSFTGLAAYAEASFRIGAPPAPVSAAQLVSCNYFEVLRARPALGRTLAPDECGRPGEAPVAVLSHGAWRRAFGGDSSVVGRTVRVSGRPVTVVGVAERDFRGTEVVAPDLWLPLSMHPILLPGVADPADRDISWLNVVGRLKPGATLNAARAELGTIARRLDAERPGRQTIVRVDRGTFANQPEVRQVGGYMALAGAAAAMLVLLVACVNVTSLALSRAVARRREIGVRLALGAGRGRLVRQLVTESAVLALPGGALGVALAWWLPPLLLAAVPSQGVQLDLAPDGRVVAFAFAVALLAAVASGLAPALQATRLDLVDALKGDRASAGGGAARLRGRLVGVQLAGSLLLLVVGGLLARGLRRAQTADPGYATAGVLAVTLDLGSAGGYTPPREAALYDAVAERLRALPGVRSVALAHSLPLLYRMSGIVTLDPASVAADNARWIPVAFTRVSGSYFATMDVPVVRGRAFTDVEARAARDSAAARPAVVSASFARRVWGAAEPLGARFRDFEHAYYVVGVAADVRNISLGEPDPPFFYGALSFGRPEGAVLLVREQEPGASPVAEAVPAIVAALDANVAASTQSFTDRLGQSMQPARTGAAVGAAVGVLATLLALVGVYGVASYNATRRTREIAVRIALGATPRHVLAVVIRDGARAVLVGLAAGALLAAGVAMAMRSVLFGLSPLDPVTFAGATVLLAAAALGAMLAPARRATRVQPASALRDE